jgi:single-strand DNA-binding protein
MSDLNVMSITGRLTKDAERKTLPTGTNLVTFSVANNTGYGDYAATNYFVVNMWGKQGEGIFPYLKKGQAVAVYGELTFKKWTAQDGTIRQNNEIRCNQVSLLASPKVDTPTAKAPAMDDATPYDDVW